MKILKVLVSRERLQEIIKNAETTADAFIEMYKAIVPDFEKRQTVNPPSASRKTIEETIGMFKQFRNDIGSDFMFLWVNQGPGVDEKFNKDWIWIQR